MKLTRKYIWIVSFILSMICLIAGCQNNSEQTMMNNAMESSCAESSIKDNTNQDESTISDGEDHTVANMAIGDKITIRNYQLYVVQNEKVVDKKEVKEYSEDPNNLEEKYTELLDELTQYIGYQIIINKIKIESERFTVDFSAESDIFHKDAYSEVIVRPVKYSDYEEMMFGILDSIRMTIQSNYKSDIKVVYTEDGRSLQLPDMRMDVSLSKDEEYKGSNYYKDLYYKRPEGQIIHLFELGEKLNDVLLALNEQEITTSQTVEFSMLGDHSGWENDVSIDDYLKKAWTHISLDSNQYEFIFDGEESVLMGIFVKDKQIPSKRGLLIDDDFQQVKELYGENYSMYVIEGRLLYEYELDDCYFKVFVDEASEKVQSYGISSYSQKEVLQGEKIVDQIRYKEYQAKNLGL